MNIKELLQKIINGEALSEDEKNFISKYDPESDENRIPKSRLDKEIQRAKEAQDRANKLQENIDDMQSRLDELENAGKSETERMQLKHEKEIAKLQEAIAALTTERDNASAKLAKSERVAAIGKIATNHNFIDFEYLDYLAEQNGLDLNDNTAVGDFMKNLINDKPELFKSNAKSGSGTKSYGSNDSSTIQTRLNELLKKTELSTREASEVIELQNKIDTKN